MIVRYFASAREAAQQAEELVELKPGVYKLWTYWPFELSRLDRAFQLSLRSNSQARLS